MSVVEFTILAFGTLFVIVDPIATVPAFLAMTPGDSVAQRTAMARLACWVMAGVLAMFGLAGKFIFKFLGITLEAFQIAGSVVLMLIALDMLRAQRSRVQETRGEVEAGAEKTDIAITPLAVPMLAGPGAISSVILLHNQAANLAQEIAVFACIGVVSVLSYFVLRFASHGTRFLNPIAMKIITRLMGLLLAAVAVQFLINGLRGLKIIPA
jgi:multiple antibiotic resistance protein